MAYTTNDDSHYGLSHTSLTNSDSRQYKSLKILKNEFNNLIKDPPEGFLVEPDVNDFSIWHVGIFGPPDTLFSGGYYKAILKFPLDYPYRPPTLRFLSDIWHPNVYPDGHVCISILHEPGEDERSGEKACERWSVVQNVRSILLSIISMLNEPNTSSPANIDASVEYRKYREDPINHPIYKQKLDRLISKSKEIAKLEGINIPHTVEEYTKQLVKKTSKISTNDIQDYLLNDDDDDDNEQSEDNYSQSSSSQMNIIIKSIRKYENNNNSSGDSNNNEYFYTIR